VEELAIRHSHEERLIAFTLDGHVLFRRSGGVDNVDITEEDRAKLLSGPAIVTHNHAADVSFSIRDMGMACSCDIHVLRAVSPKFVHTLKSPQGGWGERQCEALFARGKEVEAVVTAELRAAVDARELTPGRAHEEWWHRVWTRLAAEFHFGYWRESLSPG